MCLGYEQLQTWVVSRELWHTEERACLGGDNGPTSSISVGRATNSVASQTESPLPTRCEGVDMLSEICADVTFMDPLQHQKGTRPRGSVSS